MSKLALSLRKIRITYIDRPLFDLDFSFMNGLNGLIGRNGSGKSTLLKVACGELSPDEGKVECNGTVAYSRQQNGVTSNQSISRWLGLEDVFQALARVANGEIQQEDFDMIDGKWNLEADLYAAMTRYGMKSISLDSPVNQLSGGELTCLQLALAFACPSDVLLLDEPSNNLDRQSREQLYHDIQDHEGIVVVASHDRELLELVDRVYEINSFGLAEYGGNYSFYLEEKEKQQNAAHALVHARKNELAKAKIQVQKRREIHEQGEAKGRRVKKKMLEAKGRVDKIAFGSKEAGAKIQINAFEIRGIDS